MSHHSISISGLGNLTNTPTAGFHKKVFDLMSLISSVNKTNPSMNLVSSGISRQLSYPKCVFLLPRCSIHPFSIFAECPQNPTKPINPNSSHSLTCSQKLKKQPLTSPSTWPRPSQIPYQPKLPNFVNLYGVVQIPVQFHITADGNHMAAIIIAQTQGSFIAKSSTSVFIPVVFEGDLAHTVASHVKLNDFVYVTGKLSLSPLPFSLTQNQGNFYLIGNEINFVQDSIPIIDNVVKEQAGRNNCVQGLVFQGSYSVQENLENKIVVEEQDWNRKSSVDNNTKVMEEWDEFLSDINQWSVITSQGKGMKGAIEGFERKVDGKRLDLDSSTPVWVYNKLDELNLENKIEGKKIEPVDTEKKSARNIGGTTRDANSVFNSWRDLVKNPMDWLDYRETKSSGSVKAKHPDFKHRSNGTSLWLNSAPNWVLAGLSGLNVSGKGKKQDSSKEESWKNLVENPDKWWDNRLTKTNVKAPDFKHKETSEGLWLNSSPEWVLSQLPCSKDEHNVASVNENASVP